MTERRQHQAIRLADGRLLGFAEYGDPDGDPVVYFHGELGSRLVGRAFEPGAAQRGLRVIAPDRPGIGFSDFRPGRVVADWPADVLELAQHLGIERFAVVATTGGTPYALACAWRIPERLTAVVVAGAALPVAMVEDEPDAPRMARILRQSAVAAPWTIRLVMTLMGQMSRRSPEQALRRMEESAGDADRPVYARPEIRSMLAQSMAEVFRSGPRGAAHDLRLLAADWGLPFERISEQVGLWHGEADPEVTPAHARRLAGALPRCQLHLVPGAGHHLALSHADAVLEAVLAQRSAVD